MRTTLTCARRVLSLSVAAALSAPLVAAAANPIVADGTVVSVGGESIKGPAGQHMGHAMEALNGGTILASGMTLSTSGDEAHAAYASGVGSVIHLDNSTITTTGYIGMGLVAAGGGQVNAEGARFTSSGNNGRGVASNGVGSVVNFNGGSITTNAALFADGVRANDGGTINIGRDSGGRGTAITIAGGAWGGIVGGGDAGSGTLNIDGATVRGLSGLLAQGAGASLNVSDSTIETRNVGISANKGSQTHLEHVTIRSGLNGRDGGSAVVVEDGAAVDIVDSSISTLGNLAHGIHARTAGTATVRNADIVTAGDVEAHGMLAESNGRVVISNSRVTTTGANRSHGLAAADGGSIQASNVAIQTQGQWSRGVDARTNDAIVEISGSSVTTEGMAAHGLLAELGGSIISRGTDVRTKGSGAQGVLAHSGNIEFTGGSVINEGLQTHGLQASAGGSLSAEDATVRMTGAGSSAVYVESDGAFDGSRLNLVAEGDGGNGVLMNMPAGSPLKLSDSSIVVTGADAFGIQNFGGEGTFRRVVLTTAGPNSTGIAARGEVELNDSSVNAQGDESVAAKVYDGGVLRVSGSALSSAGTALHLDNGSLTATEGTAIEGGNGLLAEFGSDSGNTLTFDGDVVALGDIHFAAGAADADGNGALDRTSSLSLDNNSYWKGATDAIGDLSLANGSRWDVTGNSEVGNLSLTNSSVVFDHTDGQYKVLTVDGNFHADNGLLAMNTELGGDASPTDLLHVKGDTSGNAQIAVNNIGGIGAQTEDGIKLVQVDGVSAGEYALAGRAVGGAYEYFLFQGGHADPTDGDWYLRSELPPIEPPVDPCAGTGCPVDPIIDPPKPIPLLRPEGGAYLANQASAQSMFNLDLHERVGEPNLAQRQRGDGNQGGAWARVTTEQPRYRVNDQLTGQGRHNVVQVGTDLTFWGSQDRGVVGVMAASGQATNRVTSELTGYGAEGRVDGRALGIYGTWFQDAEDDDGLYIDGWLQAAHFKNRVQGDALTREQYRSRSLSASMEAGYALRLHQNVDSALYLEPQVQAIWTNYRMDGGSHQESNGTVVQIGQAGGLQTRIGARLYGHSTSATGNRVQPFVAVNWFRNGGDVNAVRMGEQYLQGIVPQDVYEAKVGAQLQLSPRLTGWGEVSTQRGSYGFRSVGGQLGVKYVW